VINVPAGFAGSRIAGAMSLGLKDGIVSRVATGVGSGFASGGVFGAVDSYVSTGSIADGGSGFWKGAAIGALSGGAISAAHGGRVSILEPARVPSSTESPQVSRPSIASESPRAASTDSTSQIHEGPLLAAREYTANMKNFDVANLQFKGRDKVSTTELSQKLGPATVGTYQRLSLPTGATFDTLGQFHSSLQRATEPASIYRFGSTELVVPSDYHANLVEVRQLRMTAEKSTRLLGRLDEHERKYLLKPEAWQAQAHALETVIADTHGVKTLGQLFQHIGSRPGPATSWPILIGRSTFAKIADLPLRDLRESLPIMKAAAELRTHPFAKRALPEDFVPLLETLPNRGLIKKLEIRNDENIFDIADRRFDPWVAKAYGKNADSYRAAATAEHATATVRFYRPTIDFPEEILQVLKHEQVHLNHDPAYALARAMDKPLETSRYAYRNDHESEAELESRAFLSQTGTFIDAVKEAPTRMALLARKLANTLESAGPQERSLDEHELRARIKYVEKKALPAALESALERLEMEPSAQSIALASTLNGTASNPRLVQSLLAHTKPDNVQFAQEAITALSKIPGTDTLSAMRNALVQNEVPIYLQPKMIEAMASVASPKRGGQERLLVQWSSPQSPIRDQARAYLKANDEYWFLRTEGGIINRPVSDDYMLLAPNGNRQTVDRARYTLQHGDAFQKRVAAIKLGLHGTAEDIPRLMTAATSADVSVGSSALRSALRLSTDGSVGAMMDHVERQALNTSPTYRAARQMLDESYGDPRIGNYREIIGHFTDPIRFQPERVAHLIAELPQTSPRREWVQEVLRFLDSQRRPQPLVAEGRRKEFLGWVGEYAPEFRQDVISLLFPPGRRTGI
jgi:hypothetical protein